MFGRTRTRRATTANRCLGCGKRTRRGSNVCSPRCSHRIAREL